jgi:hypothetical protein
MTVMIVVTMSERIRTLRGWGRQLLLERLKHRRRESLSLFPDIKKFLNLLLYNSKGEKRKFREPTIEWSKYG